MKTSSIIHIRMVSLGAVMALCLLGSGVSNSRADEKESRGQLDSKDHKFATDARACGTMEIALGGLAAQQGGDQAVREFGKRISEDQKKANDELTELVTKKGAMIEDTSARKLDKTQEHLKGLSGKEFDRAYLKEVVSDEKKAVKEFQTEADKGYDVELKSWVAKTLPMIQDQLIQAQNLEATLVASNN